MFKGNFLSRVLMRFLLQLGPKTGPHFKVLGPDTLKPNACLPKRLNSTQLNPTGSWVELSLTDM